MKAIAATAIVAVLSVLVPGVCGRAEAEAPDYATLLKSVVSVLPEWPTDRFRASQPEGTGVVVFDGTFVITANHVMNGDNPVRIRTSSGEILHAKLHSSDNKTDLALLKIERVLPPLEFGGDARLGEPACAIGNAFKLGLSVTCGTVSAVHRAGRGFWAIEDFVQTDAAVNPGASGGALIDGDGNLIGILSAILTNAKELDANIGVNFAVAAPLARRVAEDLRENREYTRHPSGASFGKHPPRGHVGEQAAEVLRVRNETSAEAAGLKRGDLVVEAGGRRIRSRADFESVMARKSPGDEVPIIIRRGQETHQLVLRVREFKF